MWAALWSPLNRRFAPSPPGFWLSLSPLSPVPSDPPGSREFSRPGVSQGVSWTTKKARLWPVCYLGAILPGSPGDTGLASFYRDRRHFKSHPCRWAAPFPLLWPHAPTPAPQRAEPEPQTQPPTRGARDPQRPAVPTLRAPGFSRAGGLMGRGGMFRRVRGAHACVPALPRSQKETNSKFNDRGNGSLMIRIQVPWRGPQLRPRRWAPRLKAIILPYTLRVAVKLSLSDVPQLEGTPTLGAGL